MVFNSMEYLLFFPAVVILHALLPHRWRWVLLLVASYVFYMWWNPRYIVLVILSTTIDYVAARSMAASTTKARRKTWLLVSIASNLGLLFTFKYWNFFNHSMADVAASLGGSWPVGTVDVLLPVGISFYTFQTMSYTIDVYRSAIPAERHLGRFALYVSFFPQLVAGPIERASRLLPQLDAVKRFDWERCLSGVQLILFGLFKKVVIADRLALYVDAVYGNVGAHGATTNIIATYAFAFQILCDFSGYSDIAIGSARVLGFDLMENFRRPYFSQSITEFWRRWHISLSSWLRDYLYIPLGGNRGGAIATYRNLMITMMLGGLWHGASWNFVIWGTLQGVMLTVSRLTLPARDRLLDRLGTPIWLRTGVRVVVTFHLACLSWVFFRADTLGDALGILGSLFGPWRAPFLDASSLSYGLFGVFVLLAVDLVQERQIGHETWAASWPAPLRWARWYALLFVIVLIGVEEGSQFIYFQF